MKVIVVFQEIFNNGTKQSENEYEPMFDRNHLVSRSDIRLGGEHNPKVLSSNR